MIAFLIYMLLTQMPESMDTVRHDSDFYISTSVGGGLIRVQDHDQANYYGRASIPNIKLGYHLNPRLALTLQFPGGIHHQKEGGDRTFEATMPGLQFWASERFWLFGGAGLSMDKLPLYESQTAVKGEDYTGLALGAGIGYEIVRQKSYSVDLQLRTLYGRNTIDDTQRVNLATDLVAGLNWYF